MAVPQAPAPGLLSKAAQQSVLRQLLPAPVQLQATSAAARIGVSLLLLMPGEHKVLNRYDSQLW